MNPKTIQQLKESSEFRELLAFLASEAAKLNDLSTFAQIPPVEFAGEVLARLRAKQTIDAMLAPLIGDINTPTLVDPKEYVVE